MATFANIVVNDEQKKSEFLNSTAITAASSSPFVNGSRVTITGYETVQVAIDGNIPDDAPYRLVFKTNIGDLALTMLLRSRVDANGNIIKPKGTFNDFLNKTIVENPTITVKELADKVCKEHPELRVNRTDYVGRAKDGRDFPASIVGFDIV